MKYLKFMGNKRIQTKISISYYLGAKTANLAIPQYKLVLLANLTQTNNLYPQCTLFWNRICVTTSTVKQVEYSAHCPRVCRNIRFYVIGIITYKPHTKCNKTINFVQRHDDEKFCHYQSTYLFTDVVMDTSLVS